MIKSSWISTTVTSRKATSIEEAEEKKRVYGIADKLMEIESKMLEKAKANDETDADFSKGQKDMVVLVSEEKHFPAFLANISEDGYVLESKIDGSSYEEEISIQKNGTTTTYSLGESGNRYFYGSQGMSKAVEFPVENQSIKMVKTVDGDNTTIKLIEGGVRIALHGVTQSVGSVIGGSIPISIKFGKKA